MRLTIGFPFCKRPNTSDLKNAISLNGYVRQICWTHRMFEFMFSENINTLLDDACQRGNVSFARILLQRGANANYTEYSGDTLLIAASRAGDAKLVSLLLKYGANVNQINLKTDESALFKACKNRHVATVKLLLAAGADVDFVCLSEVWEGNSVLDVAQCDRCDPINKELVTLLLENNARTAKDIFSNVNSCAAANHPKND